MKSWITGFLCGAAATLLVGFRGAEARDDGGRYLQDIERLRQTTVALDRKIDAVHGELGASERKWEQEIRKEQVDRRDGLERAREEASLLEKRVGGLESRIRLAVLEGETVRLIPIIADGSADRDQSATYIVAVPGDDS